MTSDAEATVTVTGVDCVDVSSHQRIRLDDIRRQAGPLMPDGEHAWVIHVVYALDDPEQALDEMDLGIEKFIGLTAIHCLLCNEEYGTVNRHHKCPGKPAED
jgi:hypothetical protein